MNLFLIINSTYEDVDVALYCDKAMIDREIIHKHVANKYLIPSIDKILHKNNISLSALSFIAVNKGPGPFTTLRTVIVAVNGISFASQIPLIGINGLEVLFDEHKQNSSTTVALLNAYGQDVYFYTKTEQGCENSIQLLERLKKIVPSQNIYFIGNGVEVYRTQIELIFQEQAIIPFPLPQFASTNSIAAVALECWHSKNNISTQIMPYYMKELRY
jgi:tRNA threonylcarbamoyladenosine biosynthesis protein TsaB